MERGLQRRFRAEGIEAPRQRVDRRAQAKHRLQRQQPREFRLDAVEREIGEAALCQLRLRLRPIARRRQAEAGQGLARVEPARRRAVEPMQRNAVSCPREPQRGQQVPGRTTRLAGVAGPVEGGARLARRRQSRPHRAHEAGDFVRALLLHPQQHQEGADLLRQRLAIEDHRHRALGFLGAEAARKRLAAPEQADELGEGVRRHGGLRTAPITRIETPSADPRRRAARRGSACPRSDRRRAPARMSPPSPAPRSAGRARERAAAPGRSA